MVFFFIFPKFATMKDKSVILVSKLFLLSLIHILLWGLLTWAMVVRGQQVEILHEGEDPVWLSEQHQFVWDKVIPLHFEAGRAVYEVHHAPKVFRLATETGYSSWFFVGRCV